VKPGNLAAWSRARLAGKKIGNASPILSIPIVPQTTDFSCGAAVLLSVLKYWLGPNALPDDEKALWGVLGTNPISGTNPEPIAAVASSLGLSAGVQDGLGVTAIPGLLASGVTAILAVQAWDRDPSEPDFDPFEGHWVVLAGADEETARLMDPSLPGGGYRDVDLLDLARRWKGLDVGRPRPGLAVLVSAPFPAP